MARQRVLAIANRGEIAIRIARTARRLGWQPVLLIGEPDVGSYAAREVGRYELVGPAGSELDPRLVIDAAKRAGADALHPGYGFLGERPDLSQACIDAGITFIGPSPETLRLCGDKIATRQAAERAGVPTLPASDPLTLQDTDDWAKAGANIGYPLIVKVASGGGGRGLRVADGAGALDAAIRSALREAGASAAGTTLYLERYLEAARHVEVQMAGDGTSAVALGDRDCSIQRRHQKVIEEAPAFGLTDALRVELNRHAVALAREVGLLGVATVEFLLSRDGDPFFIEINPRLQVEHTVTEEVTGLDLVEVQLTLAQGSDLPRSSAARGHAIQARLYAEDPTQGFVPSPGLIRLLRLPPLVDFRIDIGYEEGDEIPSHYDALIGKWIAHEEDRQRAIERLVTELRNLAVCGVATNRPWLMALLANEEFRSAGHSLATAATIEVSERAPTATELGPIAIELLLKPLLVLEGQSAWTSSGPFRIVAPATDRVHGDEAGGWERRIEYRPAALGDGWDIGVVHDGAWEPTAQIDGRTVTHWAEAENVEVQSSWELVTPDGRWIVKPGPKPRERAGAATLDGALRAPMPGKIVAIHVEPGQRVTIGEVLAVMTAMKIEITLAAPFDGVVESVGCAVGDLVGSRQALVTVTPAEASEATNG